MGGPVDVPGNQLRAIVERIEQVDDEINDLAEAKREIYAEAKRMASTSRFLEK